MMIDRQRRIARSTPNALTSRTLFVQSFAGFDYVVPPSSSCVHHVRYMFDAGLAQVERPRDI
jgi:hypothetical protein